jgi:hypothetical protein
MGKYLDMIRQHERTQPEEPLTPQRTIDQSSTLRPGAQIEWHRAGSLQHGTVDFVHVDAEGEMWAFCTQGENWAAVNVRCLTHPPVSRDALAE